MRRNNAKDASMIVAQRSVRKRANLENNIVEWRKYGLTVLLSLSSPPDKRKSDPSKRLSLSLSLHNSKSFFFLNLLPLGI
ncbi:hypothetical protein L6452_42178 [Arctium lappa]|uniref:Uncharacterized protein n=1 Tax=Arctium lappa TaxID=4217 RepID=A0ACB8XH30_ARCLA|nr:hypothetical protein L6452_42178 [Arctium lappa]